MTAREQAINAAAEAILAEESGYCGPGYGTCGALCVSSEHATPLARLALAAAVPGLLNDLADRIEAGIPPIVNTWHLAQGEATRAAAEVVRAAAEGWGQE